MATIFEKLKKGARKRGADYRNLMANSLPPVTVGQLRKIIDSKRLIEFYSDTEGWLATENNHLMSNQYDNCEVIRVWGWDSRLGKAKLTIKYTSAK